MKNLSILSIALLASVPAMAMEGQWNKEEESKVPSLESLCFKSFKTPKDPELLKKLPCIQHPKLTAGIWENFPQELIDRDNDYYINLLLKGEYPAEVRAAMIKRLTLPEKLAQKLFDAALNPENDSEEQLVACALFVKYQDWHTWEIAQKLASSGPITVEAAKLIIHTTRFEWTQLIIFGNGDNYFPEAMLCCNNHAVFMQAIMELIKEEQLEGPYIDENSTLKELCSLFIWTGSCLGGRYFKEIPVAKRTRDISLDFILVKNYPDIYSRNEIKNINNVINKEISNVDYNSSTAKQHILNILYRFLQMAFPPSTLTGYLKYYQNRYSVPRNRTYIADLLEERAKLMCRFIEKAQQHGFEVLIEENKDQDKNE